MLRVVTLGVLVCAIVLVASLIFGGESGHKYTLKFQNASQIVSGNLVMVGGHPIGSVNSVGLADDNMAEMEIEVDEPLREGTSAIIRKSSLSSVHNHYIALTMGPDNAPELKEGEILGAGSTTTAVELDQIDQFSPAACEDETSPDVWLGTSRFLYDSLGQPIRAIDAEQNSESFTYDAAGNLASYQNPGGKTYPYTHDGLNRLNRISSPAGVDLLFSYALLRGRLTDDAGGDPPDRR